MNNSEDIFFETLSLNRNIIMGGGPPFGGYGGFHLFYQNDWRVRNTKVEVWTNSEGRIHRIYGPAYRTLDNSLIEWYKDGDLHRIGGPARINNGNMFWYKKGILHNLDGPAVIEGAGPKQYWIDGVRYSPKQYKWEINRRKRRGIIK